MTLPEHNRTEAFIQLIEAMLRLNNLTNPNYEIDMDEVIRYMQLKREDQKKKLC